MPGPGTGVPGSGMGRGAGSGVTPGSGTPVDVTALKPGMTASATVVFAQKENVLAVPNRAIRIQGQSRVVDVLVDGRTEARTVKVGLSSDQVTEITEGLAEGEQVVIPGTTTATSSTVPGLTGGSPSKTTGLPR